MAMENNMTDNNCKSPNSPHFWWIISVLLIIIVVLLTIVIRGNIMCSQKIIDSISTVALLLSIILSILAIAFTYTSNSQVGNQFDKINGAANKISETVIKLSSVTDDILNRLNRLERMQEVINNKMDNRNVGVPQDSALKGNPLPPKE